jgi:hypothetical protein
MSLLLTEPVDSALPTAMTRSWFARWRPGVAELLFLLVAILVIRASRNSMLDDPGLGWHLRNVDAMIEQGGWLTTDPFTYSRGEAPARWLTNQWLGEFPFWLGWKWAGLEGIAVATAVILAAMISWLYRTFLSDGVPWSVAFGWAILAAIGTSISWVARPNVFTIVFVALTARSCVLFHEGRWSWRRTLGLWLMFVAWANAHGGIVAGLVLLGATLMIEAAQAVFSKDDNTKRAARGRAVTMLGIAGGAFVATWINPYGPGLYRWIFQLLGDEFFMNLHTEWHSPDFQSPGAMRYELLILLLPIVLALSPRRPSLVEIGLCALWLHFALGGFRYVALWVVVAVPIMARSSAAIPKVKEVAERFAFDPGIPRPRFAGLAWIGIFAVSLIAWAYWARGTYASHSPEHISAKALDRMLELHAERADEHGGVVFHSYNWGGYVTWHGWPRVKNWIDDRNEVQGRERIEEYFRVVAAEPGWESLLDRHHVQFVCIEAATPLARSLAKRPNWREEYRDDVAVIYQRQPAR